MKRSYYSVFIPILCITKSVLRVVFQVSFIYSKFYPSCDKFKNGSFILFINHPKRQHCDELFIFVEESML
jgi:hypothetical protein